MTEEIKVSYNQRDKCYLGRYKDPSTGKWKTKFIPVSCGTEAEAKLWFSRFLTDLQSNSLAPTNAEVTKHAHTITTLWPLIEGYWLKTRTNRAGDRLDPRTVKDWSSKVRKYLLTHSIAHLPMTADKFTPVALVGFIEHVKSLGLAKYTIKDCRLVLRTFIGDARKKGWVDLPFNPAADEIVSSEVPVGEPVSGKDNPIHLSETEAITLLGTTNPITPKRRRVKNWVALTTGMRDGEIQGLAWKHIDLAKRFIMVDRQLVKGGDNPLFKAPKKGSHRTIPLHPSTVLVLTWLKNNTSKTAPEDPVFPDPLTGLYARIKSAQHFRTDLQGAGISSLYQGLYPFDFHATRRTFLTLLSDAGVSEEQSSALAGHAKKGVRKHYVKDHLEKFIPAIEKLPFGKVNLEWCKQ